MDYNQMVLDAIAEAGEATGDAEQELSITLNADLILAAIKRKMNDNMVVFYQP